VASRHRRSETGGNEANGGEKASKWRKSIIWQPKSINSSESRENENSNVSISMAMAAWRHMANQRRQPAITAAITESKITAKMPAASRKWRQQQRSKIAAKKIKKTSA